jgi:hypothetical protein
MRRRESCILISSRVAAFIPSTAWQRPKSAVHGTGIATWLGKLQEGAAIGNTGRGDEGATSGARVDRPAHLTRCLRRTRSPPRS